MNSTVSFGAKKSGSSYEGQLNTARLPARLLVHLFWVTRKESGFYANDVAYK